MIHPLTSQIICNAQLCTRPALNSLAIILETDQQIITRMKGIKYLQRSGDKVYPAILSRIDLASRAFTKLKSISRGLRNDSSMAVFVIS